MLSALRAEPHVVAGALYDKHGQLFATYPGGSAAPSGCPQAPARTAMQFASSHCSGFQPVAENGKAMGTLYLRSDMGAMYDQLRLHAAIAALVDAARLHSSPT